MEPMLLLDSEGGLSFACFVCRNEFEIKPRATVIAGIGLTVKSAMTVCPDCYKKESGHKWLIKIGRKHRKVF